MAKHGKKFRAVAEKVDRDNLYSPLQAAKLAKETSTTSYDATVEVAMRLGVDPRKADQMVRGTVNLPHGTGKTARVIVFATGDKAAEAEAAGADVVGSDDLIEKIQGGFLDFDAAIATPDQMAKVGRIARILGPRGLMPNPKTGTVTPDVTKAVNDIKGGKINFRVDKQANLHLVIGKTSFDEAKLVETLGAFPLPIEVVPFGLAATLRRIERTASGLGLTGPLRLRTTGAQTFVTDGWSVGGGLEWWRYKSANAHFDQFDDLRIIAASVEVPYRGVQSAVEVLIEHR